ncbi:hypothetical protein GINT2_000712 [Glugoides intestinalis]
MDVVSWKEKKKSLKIFTSHPTQSSSLKKKLSIINKIKNLNTENFPTLLIELEKENLCKFYTEIVNNLLSIPTIVTPSPKNVEAVIDDIHKIVEIIYMFFFDNSFSSYLITTLKKGHSESWPFSCLLLETFILNIKLKKSMGTSITEVIQALLKALNSQRLPFILYCVESFDCDRQLFIEYVQKEIKSVNDENIQVLKRLLEKLDIKETLEVQSDYVEIIKPTAGEFSFYEDSKKTQSLQFTAAMIKNIEKKNFKPHVLDFIGQQIYNSPELIVKVINKKKHINFIPELARILSKAIKDKKRYLTVILNKTAKDEDLILIGECYKFGLFTNEELFSLINRLIEQNSISSLCTVLSTVGRFILYKKETNKKAIQTIEKIKQSPIDSVSRIQFTNCLSAVLNPDGGQLCVFDFLQWFFNKDDFTSTELFGNMIKSRRFILMLLCKPEVFEKKESLTRMLNCVGESMKLTESEYNRITEKNPNVPKELLYNLYKGDVKDFSRQMYLHYIPMIYKKHRTLALDFIHAIIAVTKKHSRQVAVLDTFLKHNLEERWKWGAFLILLESFDGKLHNKYLRILRETASHNIELEAILFTFCERHHYETLIKEEDSFDKELSLMDASE